MSLHEQQACFRRLSTEHPAWRLLGADHAPIILAFISDLFSQTNEVPFGRAKVALEAELSAWHEKYGMHDNAGTYLRQWIQADWMREHNDSLTRTDAFEMALRFAQGIEQRESSATASHLRIVQDAVRDLAVVLSPNPAERISLLSVRREELDREIARLEAGIVPQLWLTTKKIGYWGDLDTWGLKMLSDVRQRQPHTQALMMDRATLTAHPGRVVCEPTQASLPAAGLTIDELALFEFLCEVAGQFGRLEQERLSQDYITSRLNAWVDGGNGLGAGP